MLIAQQLKNNNVYKPLSPQKKTQANSQGFLWFFEPKESFKHDNFSTKKPVLLLSLPFLQRSRLLRLFLTIF